LSRDLEEIKWLHRPIVAGSVPGLQSIERLAPVVKTQTGALVCEFKQHAAAPGIMAGGARDRPAPVSSAGVRDTAARNGLTLRDVDP
jgi:hypothetical protein